MIENLNDSTKLKDLFNNIKKLEEYISSNKLEEGFINELVYFTKSVLTGSGKSDTDILKLATKVGDLIRAKGPVGHAKSMFQVMKNLYSAYEEAEADSIDLEIVERTLAQLKERYAYVEEIESKFSIAANKGAKIHTSKFSLAEEQYNEKIDLAKKHKEERDSIYESRDAARESYEEKVNMAYTEYEEKISLLEQGALNEQNCLDQSLLNSELSKEAKIEILNNQLEHELLVAESALNSSIESNSKKLSDLMFNQELERIELEKNQAYAILVFDNVGKAFSSNQVGMRGELSQTFQDVVNLIGKYNSLIEKQKTAAELRAEAIRQVKFNQEVAAAKAGGNPNYEAQPGDLADKGTEGTLIGSGTTQSNTPKPQPKYSGGSLVGDFNQYHNGGIFRSRNGSHEGLALLRNNELILTPEQQQNLLLGNSGGQTNNFNIANMSIREESDIDKLAMRLNKLQRIRARQV